MHSRLCPEKLSFGVLQAAVASTFGERVACFNQILDCALQVLEAVRLIHKHSLRHLVNSELLVEASKLGEIRGGQPQEC